MSDPADGFSVTSASPLQIRLVDCCVSGDAFQVYVDSVLALTTPVVADGYDGGFGDGAWGDPNLSQGSFLLASGMHILTISTYRTAEGYSGGGASIRADNVVPEPSTWLLLGAGLVALEAVRRKRV